jgi:3-hydroxyacyl-CoA dehydrogenase/3-hydroxy-2-methylbutyryl-CoA dehydrogenase
MDFSRCVVLVTGGGSGLGEGTVRRAQQMGASVAILDLEASRGRAIAAELGERAVFYPVDVRDTSAVEQAVQTVVTAFGRLDVTVNCAGVADAARVISRDGSLFPMDTFRRVLDINLAGLFDVTRHSALHMSKNDPNDDGERGVIINVASIAGIEGQAGQAAYSGSKGGVIAMTLPLARDLSSFGIRVMTICPGIFETGMLASASDQLRARLVDIHVFPKRLGRPSEFAHLVQSIVENPMLNGEVIRLDAATRLSHG